MPATPIKSFEKVGAVIKGVAAIYALFPGVAVLLGLVAIPPSLIDLVKIIAFSVSGIVILSVFMLDDQIRRIGNGKAVLFTVVAVLLGSACAIGYYQFANDHTVVVETESGATQHFITPLNPSSDILKLVHPRIPAQPTTVEYKRAMQIEVRREDLKTMVRGQSFWTMVIMIVLLVLSEVLLIAPIVAAAWKLAYVLFGQPVAAGGGDPAA